MNKLLHKTMVLAMLLCFATSMWAIESVEGVYQVSSAADLKAFAELVNGGQNEIQAVMTADIVADADQPMIGTSANWFKGTFDGQLHKLTLNWTGDHALSQDPSGLFARMAGTVQNLYVDGNVETTGVRTGVLVGRTEGASVIKNVITNVTLTVNVSGDCAASMLVSRPSAGTTEIANCIAMGKIVGPQAIQAGGLVGWNPNDVITNIRNSAMLGTIQVAASSGTTKTDLIGRCLESNAPIKLENVFYVLSPENQNVERIWKGATEVQAEDVKSGALTFKLNGDQTEISWYQKVGEDVAPSLDPSRGQVYLNGKAHCDGTPYEDAYYSNENIGLTLDEHTFTNGVCTVCGTADPNFVTLSDDGFYLLGTPEQLVWLASKVNAGDVAINGRLTAAIDLAGIEWTPIGSTSANYAGSFDGQLYPITNLNGILFGTVSGAQITGIAIESATVSTNGGTAAHTGSIVGHSPSKETSLTNSYSKATILGGEGDLGGISGKFLGTLKNVAFIGSFDGSIGTYSLGGLLGSTNSTNTTFISNCIVVAELGEGFDAATIAQGGTGARGGIVGWCHTNTATNCFVISDTFGGFFGDGTGSTSACEFVSAEDFASGRVTYTLNGDQSEIAWYQKLNEDMLPSLDKSRGQVYLNGRAHCDGTPYEDAFLSNTNSGLTQDPHVFVDGVCTVCGAAETGFVTIGEDGYYDLATAEQLAWVASKVNAGNPDINARLTAAIDLQNIAWVPIGTDGVRYKGTFDGQMYPITNINGMMFGTIDGAQITGVAIESGTVSSSAGNAHTGGLVGYSPTKESSVTNSYSKVTITGGDGDLGGIAGKYLGTLDHVYFAGTFDGALGTYSLGGLLGSTNSTNTTFISNCFVFANLGEGLDPNSSARGGIVGWCHTNTAYNTYVVSNADGRLSFTKLLGDGTGSTSGCAFMTEEEFNNGAVTWALNGGSFADVTWYQSLTGDAETSDLHPTLDPTHEIVYPTVDGFASAGAGNFDEMRKNLIDSEVAYCNNAIANVEVKNTYLTALEELRQITERDAFIEAYSALKTLRADVEASEQAYAAFIAFVQDIYAKTQESTITGFDMEFLVDYISNEYEPNEDYPHGSYPYILNSLTLTTEQLQEEQNFVNEMWQRAQKNGYKTGDEITNMLVNASLADGFNGWEYTKTGSTFTTGGVKEVMPAAESWNATFDLKQTLTELADGFYRLDVNAAFRAAGDIYNTNYAAWAHLNEAETYVMTEGEDVVSEDDARDLENCYINGGVLFDEEGNHVDPFDNVYSDLDNNIYGYVPYGPLSCSYAFKGGRYVNTVVVQVTDGTLTVGLKLPGTGVEADWMGFGNFHVTYLGDAESELTADAYDTMLAGMVARANTILAYHGDSGADYKVKPEFSAALREELSSEIAAAASASTVEEKQALAARFTETFRHIYDCKKAYANYMASVESLSNAAWAQAASDPGITEEMLADLQNFMDNEFAPKWENGEYSQQDAEAMDDLKNSAIYVYLNSSNPAQVGGVYQLASAEDMRWLSRMAAMGVNDIKAELTAAIDLSEVDWTPIGSIEVPFAGSFDGHLYPISGINNMLFGTTAGATITGVALVSGQINVGDAVYASHNGTIIGHAATAAPTTLTRSYSLVDITSTNGGDIGGLSGKFYGTIDNCFYKGSISGGNTTGGLIGSSSESATPAHISNSYSFCSSLGAAWYMDGLVGWLHSNCSLTNCYAVASTDGRGFGSNWVSGSTNTNCAQMSAAQFASGEVAFLLNQGQDAPVWFQTLDDDDTPVLDATHKVVLKDESGTYYNDGSGLRLLDADAQLPATVTVYDMQGRAIRQGVDAKKALEGLPNGLYIIGGKKMLK